MKVPLDARDLQANPQTANEYRRALITEQAQRLLRVVTPQRAAVYLTAMRTGLRRCELQRLTVGDVAFDAPKPFARVRAAISKGNRPEIILWLPDEVVSVIRAILPDNAMPYEKLFAGMVPRLPRFKQDLKLAGIPFVDDTGRRLNLHALRLPFCMDAGAACGGICACCKPLCDTVTSARPCDTTRILRGWRRRASLRNCRR